MQVEADAEDWSLVLGGDGEAFGRIFDRRKEQVRRQARRLLDGRLDAEDAVAIVFLEAWRKRTSVRVVDGSLLPWLLVTAVHVARNIRRGRTRYEGLISRLPAPDAVLDPSALAEERDVLTAMRTLSLEDQQVLTLCVLEGWSQHDAAAALEVAPGTVKSRLFRAKRRLAQRIDRPGGVTSRRGVSDGA